MEFSLETILFVVLILSFGGVLIEGFLIKPFWHWRLLSVVYPKQYGDLKGYFSIMFFGIYTISFTEQLRLGMPIFMDERLSGHSLIANNFVKRLVIQRTRIVLYLAVTMFSTMLLLLASVK